MLAEFSIVPLGAGSSISSHVAKVIKIVDTSGLPYKINPMGTVIEGTWGEIMRLIKKCHDAVMKTEDRVLVSIAIDNRKSKTDRINQKIRSVEKKLGKPLRK